MWIHVDRRTENELHVRPACPCGWKYSEVPTETLHRIRLVMSAMVHRQNTDLNAMHSSHYKKPLDSMHNSVFTLAALSLPGLSQCQCQSRLSSRLRQLIKHAEAVQLNCIFFYFQCLQCTLFSRGVGVMC